MLMLKHLHHNLKNINIKYQKSVKHVGYISPQTINQINTKVWFYSNNSLEPKHTTRCHGSSWNGHDIFNLLIRVHGDVFVVFFRGGQHEMVYREINGERKRHMRDTIPGTRYQVYRVKVLNCLTHPPPPTNLLTRIFGISYYSLL